MKQRIQRPGAGGSGLAHALLYRRISKGESAREGFGLPSQLQDGRRYIASRDGWVIAGEFTDVMKGTRDDRPDYQAMLAEARRLSAEGKRVVVVVKWLHRLGRKLRESVRCREEFTELAIPIHSVMEGGEVSDLLANIMASVAEYEVQQLGERVREVNRHLRGNGWAKVGRCPWGYTWRAPTATEKAQGAPKRVLAKDARAARAVVEFFERVAAGESVRRAAAWAAGLPPAARGGGRPATKDTPGRPARSLGYSALQDTLRARVYTGHMEAEDGTLQRGRWAPLIDEDLWQRAQAGVASHQHTPHQASGRYLLTGLLRCPQCGGRMVGRTRDAEGRARQYVCAARMAGANRTSNSEHPRCTYLALAPAIETVVLAEAGALLDALLDPARLAAVRRDYDLLRRPRYADDVAAQLRRHEAQAARARQRLKAAGLQLLDDVLSADDYRALKQDIERDLATAEAAVARLQADAGQTPRVDLPELDVALAQRGPWPRLLREGAVPDQREVLAALIETITPQRVARGHYTVAITWAPEWAAVRGVLAAA